MPATSEKATCFNQTMAASFWKGYNGWGWLSMHMKMGGVSPLRMATFMCFANGDGETYGGLAGRNDDMHGHVFHRWWWQNSWCFASVDGDTHDTHVNLLHWHGCIQCYYMFNDKISVLSIEMTKFLQNPYKIDPPRKIFENESFLKISF